MVERSRGFSVMPLLTASFQLTTALDFPGPGFLITVIAIGGQRAQCPEMSAAEPVWRVRTRPCPFYQRGACIFAANCNFLHATPTRKDSGYDSDSSVRSLKSPEPLGRPPTPDKKPVVVVDSPRSRSACSTPREPHMSRLLSALSPVIGGEDDDEGGDQYMDSVTLIEPPSASWSDGLPTLVHGADTNFFAQVTETMAEMMRVTGGENEDHTFLDHVDDDPYDFSDSFFSNSTKQTSPFDSGSPEALPSLHPQSPDVSPSNATLRLPSYVHESLDTPSIHTTDSSPDPVQIMEMPAIPDNHNDLLSPVDLSHLFLNNFSMLDDVPEQWKDTNSIDSGFVDLTKPIATQVRSPPKSPVTSTFGLLQSPFGSPSARVLSPSIGAFIGRSPNSPRPGLPLDYEKTRLEDDLDSPGRHQMVLNSPEPNANNSSNLQTDLFPPTNLEEMLPPSLSSTGGDNESDGSSGEEDEEGEEGDYGTSSDEDSLDDDDYDNTQQLESYGHTDIWDLEGGSTSIYVGSQSPYLEQVEEELRRQSSQSMLLPGSTEPSFAFDDDRISSPKSPSGSSRLSPSSSPYHDVVNVELEVPLSAHSGATTYDNTGRWTSEDFSTVNADITIEAIDYPVVDDRSPAYSASSNQGDDYADFDHPSPPNPTEHRREVERLDTEGIAAPPADDYKFSAAPAQNPAFDQDNQDNHCIEDLSLASNADATSGSMGYINEDDLWPTSDEGPFGNAQETGRFDSTQDSTALLEYLQPESQDGDTLYSLYDVYNDFPAPPQAPPSPSNPSTPSSSLRERVFTPPPDRVPRYGPPPVRSPAMVSSPPTSVRSISKGRESPSSLIHQPALERPSSQQSNDGPSGSSKKVPFGFRAHRYSSRASLLSSKRSLLQLATNNLGNAEDQQYSMTPPSSAGSAGVSSSLRPLRLSVLLHSHSTSTSISHSATAPSNITSFAINNYALPDIHDPVTSRNSSLTNNPLSAPQSAPHHATTNPSIQYPRTPSLLTEDLSYLATFASPISAPVSAPSNWPSHHPTHHFRPSSRLSEPIYELEQEEGDDDTNHRHDVRDETIRRPIGPSPRSTPISRTRPESTLRQSLSAIATPKPTLMFAIASDDVEQVRQVLENGDANPNDCVGPQSALAFALSNDQLLNKLDIVKTLLAFGADPSALKEGALGKTSEFGDSGEGPSESPSHQPAKSLMDDMDPATRYYVERAKAPQTRRASALIHRSFFRPLTRVRYDLIGQDRALEELFKLLSIHSRKITVSPLVVMFSGPSGHGKSLLARKFGSLLDVPTHTVNMVTLRSQDDLWESYSISPFEEPTNCTLAEFLANNEGKRCVVVLDEIEKVENPKVLWSLLMPWEHGRCSFEARSRHTDVRNVIWLCTSNIGQDLVFDHWNSREYGEEVLTRQEFLDLVALLRPLVSERLGASVLSRITSVLPFVPFTLEEKRAISAEAIFQLGGEDALALSTQDIDSLIQTSLGHYIPEEGARSLHRAISNHIVDMI